MKATQNTTWLVFKALLVMILALLLKSNMATPLIAIVKTVSPIIKYYSVLVSILPTGLSSA